MDPQRQYFQIKEGGTKSLVWYFKDWNTYHKILASNVESFVVIGDTKLRFFLRPFENRWKNKNTTQCSQPELVTEGYSLCTQVLSHQMKVGLNVKTKIKPIRKAEATSEVIQDACVTVEKSGKNQAGTEVVFERFWKTAIWQVRNDNGEKNLESQWRYYYLQEYDDLEIEIDVILCEFVQEKQNMVQLESSKIKMDKNLLPSQIQLYMQGQKDKIPFSDVSLKMQDNVIVKAHRLILASRSPVFEAMFISDMKESQTQTVDIPDISSDVMKLVLQYIYLGELDPSWSTLVEELIYAASKYQLEGLIDYFDKALITVCTPNNVISLLKLATQHNLQNASVELKSYAELHAVEILMSQLQCS